MKENRSAIIIGASSDIGTALSKRWLARGWSVYGTYKTKSPVVSEMSDEGVNFVRCDVSNLSSIRNACGKIKKLCPAWDVLVMCPAIQGPLDSFAECDFSEWGNSVQVNFTSQFRIIHGLLALRRAKLNPPPCILSFSGGGINEAPTNFSAYIISKIATIKMYELLDAEVPDARFVVVGPGWVKTKIHRQMIEAGPKAPNYQRTLEKFRNDDFTPMERILDCCDWVINAPKKIVGGRNISVVHDDWSSKEFEKKLSLNQHLAKLRKHGSI